MYNCLVLNVKVNSHGLPCYRKDFVFHFLSPKLKNGIHVSFFTRFEQLKKVEGVLSSLVNFTSIPIKKKEVDLLNEKEVTDTLSVQSLTILP